MTSDVTVDLDVIVLACKSSQKGETLPSLLSVCFYTCIPSTYLRIHH